MSRVVRKIPSSVIAKWNDALKRNKAVEGVKEETPIDSISIVLFEGETYSADIVLMNGDPFSGPHLEVTFWDDGTDISHNISMNERIDSEFNLTDRQMNKEFTLCLEPLD